MSSNASRGWVPLKGSAPAVRRKRGFATVELDKFSENPSIKVGSSVKFPLRRGGEEKAVGTVARIFRLVDSKVEEARIKGPGGGRWYRRQDEMELVSSDEK